MHVNCKVDGGSSLANVAIRKRARVRKGVSVHQVTWITRWKLQSCFLVDLVLHSGNGVTILNIQCYSLTRVQLHKDLKMVLLEPRRKLALLVLQLALEHVRQSRVASQGCS